jgi:hypothetical protein
MVTRAYVAPAEHVERSGIRYSNPAAAEVSSALAYRLLAQTGQAYSASWKLLFELTWPEGSTTVAADEAAIVATGAAPVPFGDIAKDAPLSTLTNRQVEEIKTALEGLGISLTDARRDLTRAQIEALAKGRAEALPR